LSSDYEKKRNKKFISKSKIKQFKEKKISEIEEEEK
jgi:hypothetical protein